MMKAEKSEKSVLKKEIRTRIKELRYVLASELIPNPKNWRLHPEAQRSALNGVLAEVGYADALLARETPDGLMLIDGHLRAEETPMQKVPVLVLDVTESEADIILATLDPLASLADKDSGMLAELVQSIDAQTDELLKMLEKMSEEMDIFSASEIEAPLLADGDRAPFRQVTFTLHDDQFEEIEAAIKKAKSDGGGQSLVNENSNGNALAFICGAFNRG